jgi:hypothetical protein
MVFRLSLLGADEQEVKNDDENHHHQERRELAACGGTCALRPRFGNQ